MSHLRLSRRHWLRNSSALCSSALALNHVSPAKVRSAEPAAGALNIGSNRLPRMVHEHYVGQVREIMERRSERLKSLQSRAEAEKYLAEVQEKIQQCFGPWPERTPLNAQVTGVVERETYRIEKVIFESRPQFYVTANLYVPKGLKGKAPGVVGSCGHSHNGKANETYQSFAQGLARLGYVVLIFDPIGQGERLQLPHDDDHNKSRVGNGVGEHMMCGNQQFLVGEFFGSWRAWDGIRALDYLLTRDEVDPQHVGITGNSGGGTMTTWLCGVERRWTMGAPSCFVTSFLRNLQNELPADTEQCPPRALELGLDHGDFLIAMAPKPVIICGQEMDYFDARGLYATYEQVRDFYKLFGAEQNVAYHIGPGGHGYQKDAREAMYAHFNRATGRGTESVAEPHLTIETDATLQCTKSGQVSELKGRAIYSFTQEKAKRLSAARKSNGGANLLEAVRRLTQSAADGAAADYRILRPQRNDAYPLPHVTTYLIDHVTPQRGPGLCQPLYRLDKTSHHSRPPKLTTPAILYVAHDSCDLELRHEPLIRAVLKEQPGATLYAADVRGLGESRPNTCGENSYYTAYGCDYFYAAHGIMLGQSVVRNRIDDVRTAIDFITAAGHEKIHVVAAGYGAVPAAIAALDRTQVDQVTLKHALTSWQDLADAEVYKWPLSSMLPGVLEHFDLPEVYRELQVQKKLRLVEPWNASKEVV